MSKYSRSSGYYDHSNNRWIDGNYYSSNTEIPTLKDWLEFIGFIWGIIFLIFSVIETGSWLTDILFLLIKH